MWIDLAYMCKELARHVQAPTEPHQRLKRMLRYIDGTTVSYLYLGDGFTDEKDELTIMADAIWASDEERRSTTNGIALYGGMVMVIPVWSLTRLVVSLSSCKVELLAVSIVAQEGKLI
eukprot:13148078-Heterocapsa_arctica.AAC.1